MTNLKIDLSEDSLINLLQSIEKFYSKTKGIELLSTRNDMLLEIIGTNPTIESQDQLYDWLTLPKDFITLETKWKEFQNYFYKKIHSNESD